MRPCPTSLRINRKRWLRGTRSYVGSSYAARVGKEAHVRRCCLGHLSEQAGMPDSLLRNASAPVNEFRVALLNDGPYVSDFAVKAIIINDNLTLSDAERERQLIELFAKNNINLSFVG